MNPSGLLIEDKEGAGSFTIPYDQFHTDYIQNIYQLVIVYQGDSSFLSKNFIMEEEENRRVFKIKFMDKLSKETFVCADLLFRNILLLPYMQSLLRLEYLDEKNQLFKDNKVHKKDLMLMISVLK